MTALPEASRVKAALDEIYGRTSSREDAVIRPGKLDWSKLTPEKQINQRVKPPAGRAVPAGR